MYISYAATEEEAEKFLDKYNPSREIPVPIAQIVEIKLKIDIIPRLGLLKDEGIDAFLSHDFKELTIDFNHYMDQTNRSRFTLAHEMGHLVLHQPIVNKIKTLSDWRKFILGEGTGRAVYEVHADNFAGCVLMPRRELLIEYEALKKTATQRLKEANLEADEDMIISYIANDIGRKFDVSPLAAEIRLKKALGR